MMLDLVRKGLLIASTVLSIVALLIAGNLGGVVVIPLLLYMLSGAFLTGIYVVSERTFRSIIPLGERMFGVLAEMFSKAYSRAFLGAVELTSTARRAIEALFIALGIIALISVTVYGVSATGTIALAEMVLALFAVALVVYIGFRVGRILAFAPGILGVAEACRTTLAFLALAGAISQGASVGVLLLLSILAFMSFANVVVCEISAYSYLIPEGTIEEARIRAKLAGLERLELRQPLPVSVVRGRTGRTLRVRIRRG